MTTSPLADFLIPEGFAGPRGVLALAREASVVTELARYRKRMAMDKATRKATPYVSRWRSEGEPVLLIPGFLAGDYSLRGMHTHLRRQGHRTYRSGITANVGCIDRTGESLAKRVEYITEQRGRKVTLVGHSLGGMLARGLAARRPDLISGLVTMGSPMLAPGAAHSILLAQVELLRRAQGLGLSSVMGKDCTEGGCARRMFEESQLPLPASMPFTAVYSKRDGITDWRACIDPGATPREVRSSHIGMAFDPVVFDEVVSAIAQITAQCDSAFAAAVNTAERSA